MYNVSIKNTILDTLRNKVSSIVDSVNKLAELGYIPNKSKRTKLDWSSILIDAYQNIDVLKKEQQDSVDRIFNKIIKL